MASKSSFSSGKCLDITQAEKLQKRLLSAIEKNCDIEFSCDQIERIDTAGLQLLLAFKKSIKQKELSITWKNPSEIFIANAQRLGLTQELELH